MLKWSFKDEPSEVWHTQITCFSIGDLFTEAADAAMEAMKGRLANQYYMKAEEAWSAMEE